MNIAEMHVWFRQYAQQMGMQNTRAILPEQIDNLIYTSSLDTVDEVINRSVGSTNDRIITDNSKLANINALRNLYRVFTLDVKNNDDLAYYDTDGAEKYTIQADALPDYRYIVDFSIKYGKQDADDVWGNLTRWFPIRVIDDSYLADALNDFVLAPRARSPILVTYGTVAKQNNTFVEQPPQFDIYFGDNGDSVTGNLQIYQIRISYIKQPNKVAYLTDIGGTNVDSDLPEQLHIPMLKHAVDLYRISMQGSLYANQQNAQQNQQELVRNNARPDNDGYQS